MIGAAAAAAERLTLEEDGQEWREGRREWGEGGDDLSVSFGQRGGAEGQRALVLNSKKEKIAKLEIIFTLSDRPLEGKIQAQTFGLSREDYRPGRYRSGKHLCGDPQFASESAGKRTNHPLESSHGI